MPKYYEAHVTIQWVAVLLHEDASLVGCDTMFLDGWFLTFQRIIATHFQGEAVLGTMAFWERVGGSVSQCRIPKD